VRVGILGGGPAGLYLALLLKKADRAIEVSVLERNAPDATFGWGVVFSDETLGALRNADNDTYLAITESFARWDAIDVIYGGQLVRSRGHAFAAIARKRLLAILQERCRSLGVELAFGAEVAGTEAFAGADLIVAADGVNSTARREHAPSFRPRLDVHQSKFAWFGTDLVFDAFTFIFRTTRYGMFQVHAYPFDANTSTFIVECGEGTWSRAGLDELSEEESIAFCQELFAPELGGHKLLSNRSLWTSFVTVRCASWHHGNVVLAGDAAHTAHFTIGSGTKLAMEDAISLANAITGNRGDLEAALTTYEMERQPVVERFQEAARASATYFEDVRRYAGFDPVQFSFNLLTRSGRITHLELEKRDARFVAAVDRWFAATAAGGDPEGLGEGPRKGLGGGAGGRLLAAPPAFTPLRAGGTELSNRVALAPASGDDAVEGVVGEAHAQRLRAAGNAGAGLVVTELVAVSPDGRITPGTPGLYTAEQAEAWAAVTREARGAGAKLALRLGHAGRRGSTRPRREGTDLPLVTGGWRLVSASAIAYNRFCQVPDALDPEGMARVKDAFAAAAGRAATAGVDAVLLDLAHGYLLGSFVSPLTNRRDDGYGGAIEQRMRYPLEVLDAVRAALPPGIALWASLPATDWAPGGITEAEAVTAAKLLADHGAGLIHVLGGQTSARSSAPYGRAFLLPYSDLIRNEAGVRTMVGGNVTTIDEINTILAAGRADLCVLDPRVLDPRDAFDPAGAAHRG
jgi:anthraniloyl-CoA monooxygenase